MKNINYDLIKLLHACSDMIWRLENHYVNDAEVAQCHSLAVMKKILQEEKEHEKMLMKEIEMRVKAKVFK